MGYESEGKRSYFQKQILPSPLLQSQAHVPQPILAAELREILFVLLAVEGLLHLVDQKHPLCDNTVRGIPQIQVVRVGRVGRIEENESVEGR